MSDNDAIVIRPQSVPLSDAAPVRPTQTSAGVRHDYSRWWLGLGACALLAVGGWVFFVLPDQISPVPTPSRGSVHTATAPAVTQGAQTPPAPDTSAPPVTPFRDLQLERAKEQASAQLATFVELQIELEEQMQVGSWGATEYATVKDQATAGDGLFVERKFEPALAAYAAATQSLQALRAKGEDRYQTSLDAGLKAIAEFNQPLAEYELGVALQVKPTAAAALSALRRAQAIPQIERLLREARQRTRRGELNEADAAYQAILALDPQTPGVTQALAELTVARAEVAFQQALSMGFAELERGRYGPARKAFNAALKLQPGDAVAQGGLQQIAQETEVRGLRTLQTQAREAVAAERWQDALVAFEAALETDPNLRFAIDGKRSAGERLRYLNGMKIIIDQSEKLSDNSRMTQAEQLLNAAAALPSSGDQWDSRLAAARAVIARYRQPVQVTLTSDNETEITVYKVGKLGAFATHELELRPGVYTIVGSRDGCRDVRKEVVVKPQMAPIEIRCEQRL